MKRTKRQAQRFLKKKNKKIHAKTVKENKKKRQPPQYPTGPTGRTTYPT